MSGRSMRGTKVYGGSGTSHSNTTAFGVATKHKHLKFFPMKGKFTSEQEVDEYLGGDTIQCLECGLEKKLLGKHLTRHGISDTAYKMKYAIPLGRKLICLSYKAVRSEIVKRLNAQLSPEEMAEKMRKMITYPKKKYDFKNEPDFIKKKSIAMGKNNIGKRRTLEKVSVACPECNIECFAPANVAKRGNFLCEQCRERHYYDSQDRYRNNNRDKVRENARIGFAKRKYGLNDEEYEVYKLNQTLIQELRNGK